MDRLRVTLVDNIARRYPKTTIIVAHLGNPDYAWAEMARWNPNMFFDLSGSTLIKKQEDLQVLQIILWWSSVASPHTPKSQTSAFEKVIFGSDVFGGGGASGIRSIAGALPAHAGCLWCIERSAGEYLCRNLVAHTGTSK